jgi:hypothetical protein
LITNVKVKEVGECGRHCPLLEGLASPQDLSGSRSMPFNFLWILDPFETPEKAMDSKENTTTTKRYAPIR